KNGEIDIIVGTHALIQDDVIFKNLGFIIIDEQHRFGVNQRLKLINKGENPDVLIMTATPIPRTLALTVYGDMEVSTIDEMPVGRKKVKTVLSSGKNPDDIYNFIDTELNNGNQVFFIYPLIEESELLDLKAATDMYEVIKKRFTGFGVGLLHGKMKSSEKNEIMEKFSSKDYRILVSTTVVEVGVNIPDATVMVIEHADRFGLSQLHQLRGRVGRSKKQAYCFLLTENNVSQETKSKLIDFTNTHNGFKVSEIDLEWRGPGKFFGTDQHGIPEFKLLDIIKDYKMIENIRNDIENIISENDFNEKYKDLIHEIKIRYRDNIDLINAL
ncbi:MAG TPA: helicase-related protein, partial [Tepiditoga sp.]|nr:helicase-related protein [Tepiditoga sp.]